MTSFRFLALLGLGAVTAPPATAVIFTLSASVTGDFTGTYSVGQDVEIVFTLDPNRGVDLGTDLYDSNAAYIMHYGEEAADPAFWSNVTAEGLIGDWEPRATRGSGTDRILTYYDSDQIGILTDGRLDDGGIGMTASGQVVTNIYFVATFTGLDFQDPGSLVDPNTYYADYYGTYAVASEDTAQYQIGGNYVLFDINTLTISAIPEPTALLSLTGLLAAMGVALRRRR